MLPYRGSLPYQPLQAAFLICNHVPAAELVLIEELYPVLRLHLRILRGMMQQYFLQVIHLSQDAPFSTRAPPGGIKTMWIAIPSADLINAPERKAAQENSMSAIPTKTTLTAPHTARPKSMDKMSAT